MAFVGKNNKGETGSGGIWDSRGTYLLLVSQYIYLSIQPHFTEILVDGKGRPGSLGRPWCRRRSWNSRVYGNRNTMPSAVRVVALVVSGSGHAVQLMGGGTANCQLAASCSLALAENAAAAAFCLHAVAMTVT